LLHPRRDEGIRPLAIAMRELLEPIAHHLQNPQDLDQILSAVARRVAEEVTAVGARLWLIRRGDMCQTCHWARDCPDKRRCLHLKANFGFPVEPAYRRAPLIVLSGEQLARGSVLTWTPPPSAAAMLLDPRLADEHGIVSFIAHPLRVENRVLGLLTVFGARMFTKEDFEICAIQAAAASTAIRVAELVNRVQRADTTARDKSRELAQQTRLLTAILTYSTDRAILVEDLDGNILAFNEGARRAYGYNPEELIGRAVADKLHAPEDWNSGQVAKIYQQALEQGSYVGEIRRQHRDGRIFVEHTTLTALRDEEGDPAGFLSIAPVETGDVRTSPAAEVMLAALEDLAAVRRPENIFAETLAQMCRLSDASAAALFTLEGETLSVRAIHGGAAFVTDVTSRKWSPGDAPELFRALEHGQLEPLTTSAAKLLVEPTVGSVVVPMLRQQVQSVVVLVAPKQAVAGPLLQLAKLAAAFLKWQLLADQLERREQALAAQEAQHQQLAGEYEQLVAAHQAAQARIAELEAQLQDRQQSVQAAKAAQQAAEAQVANLESKLAALEAEQAHLIEAYQQSEVIANQARQTAAEAVARSESLAAAYETASQEKDLLRSRVELLEADLRQTRLQADHAIHQHAEALMQLHNLEEALNARTRALQMAEQSLVELRERYEAAHHQMTGHISQLENQLAEAQQALSSREAEAKQLTVQLRELQDELATAQQARRDAQQTVETLQHDLASAQQLLSEAVLRSQTAERTVAEIEARAAKLLSEVIAAHEEQARLIKECEALEAALAASKAETERHVQAVKFFEAQVDALERTLASSEVTRAALMQRMETLLEERVVWRRTLDHLEARLADRHLSVAGELASSDDEKPSGACPPAEVARLQELLAQREAENASLRQRLSLLQGTYRETVAVLQSRLDDLTKLNVITGAHRRLEDMLLEPSLPAQATSIVVVACDDEALRTQLATWCQQAGYQTNQVTNSDATLATLMLDPPQGIVLAGTPDHISTTYRRIRRNPDWRALPVVVITPKSFTGVSTSPSTWLLDEQAVSLSTLQRALRRWSMA